MIEVKKLDTKGFIVNWHLHYKYGRNNNLVLTALLLPVIFGLN